jgi:hypothetical protein
MRLACWLDGAAEVGFLLAEYIIHCQWPACMILEAHSATQSLPMMLPDTITTFVIYSLGLYLAYFAAIALYRVTLHPLAPIPGPRLASITYLYEWYHDIYHIGRFPWKLRDLHEKYGPLDNIIPSTLFAANPAKAPSSESRQTKSTSKIRTSPQPSTAAAMDAPINPTAPQRCLGRFPLYNVHPYNPSTSYLMLRVSRQLAQRRTTTTASAAAR